MEAYVAEFVYSMDVEKKVTVQECGKEMVQNYA
jgi:predicted RNA-binding protein Jag